MSYFAILREQRGLSRESLETNARTFRELYAELKARHGFTLTDNLVKAADRGELVELDTPLADGADVVFIPPVAGG
ncbi:MAG: MoaD/ThiS family protein [Fimbriimonadaceae bacterium]